VCKDRKKWLFADRGFLAAGMIGIFGQNFERVQIDVPYGQLRAQSPQPMHQSSMMTSSELRRRIEPTGQPTMQSGSRHWRQLVATRK